MIEMRQSVRIMLQCIERLRKTGGPISTPDGKIVPPSRSDMKRSMEALIQHFKLYSEGFHVPAGNVYVATESHKGEFGVYLVADGTNKAYRAKIRSPCFAHLQAIDYMNRGHLLADVSSILGSLDIVFGEIDR
jgi:NADH-quinone oxidoreductase subunit D